MFTNFYLAFCLKLRDSNRHKSTIEILRVKSWVNQLSVLLISQSSLFLVMDLNWHFVKPLLSQSLRIGDCLSKWEDWITSQFLELSIEMCSRCIDVLYFSGCQSDIVQLAVRHLWDGQSVRTLRRKTSLVRGFFRVLRVLVMFLEVPRSPGLGTCHSHGATWRNGKGRMSWRWTALQIGWSESVAPNSPYGITQRSERHLKDQSSQNILYKVLHYMRTSVQVQATA